MWGCGDLKMRRNFTAYPVDDPQRFNLHFNPVGIIENPASSDIRIYASANFIYVTVQINFSGQITIYNLLGKEIARHPTISNSINKISMNTSPGNYILKVTGNNKIVTAKVFIQESCKS